MSEIMEQEELLETSAQAAEGSSGAETAPETVPKRTLRQKWKDLPRKKRRRIIRRTILLLILIVAALVLYRIFGKGGGEGESQVITDMVQYSSITSIVEGSGVTRAKSSETITLTTAGTVLDVSPPCSRPGATWMGLRSSWPPPRRTSPV